MYVFDPAHPEEINQSDMVKTSSISNWEIPYTDEPFKSEGTYPWTIPWTETP